VKSNRTSLQEGKSDSERVGSRGVVRETLRALVGMWLEDIVGSFSTRYTQWTQENHERQEARKGDPWAGMQVQHKRSNVAANLTVWSPSRVVGQLDSRVGAPRTIFVFSSVLTRHSNAVREANTIVVRWKKSRLAAFRMECMANAMNASGSVDEAKIHACDGDNITDISYLKLVIDVRKDRVSRSRHLSWIDFVQGTNLRQNFREALQFWSRRPAHGRGHTHPAFF